MGAYNFDNHPYIYIYVYIYIYLSPRYREILFVLVLRNRLSKNTVSNDAHPKPQTFNPERYSTRSYVDLSMIWRPRTRPILSII